MKPGDGDVARLGSQLFDFGSLDGPVSAHRHLNPDGSTGGWVADTAFAALSVYTARPGSAAWLPFSAQLESTARLGFRVRRMYTEMLKFAADSGSRNQT